jgi:hypothetical protein
MAGPWGALPMGPAASTTDVEDDKVLIPPCVQILIGSCKVKHGKQQLSLWGSYPDPPIFTMHESSCSYCGASVIQCDTI